MQYIITEKENKNAVHSVGYWGEQGKKKAQARIDKGECIRYWTNKKASFVVRPKTSD